MGNPGSGLYVAFHLGIFLDPCMEEYLEETQDLGTELLLECHLGGPIWNLWEALMVLEVGKSW